jgi:hypothetical protein
MTIYGVQLTEFVKTTLKGISQCTFESAWQAHDSGIIAGSTSTYSDAVDENDSWPGSGGISAPMPGDSDTL